MLRFSILVAARYSLSSSIAILANAGVATENRITAHAIDGATF